MGNATRKCGGCGKEQDAWRACSKPPCRTEICYCVADGGDQRAVAEMEKHIAEEHAA